MNKFSILLYFSGIVVIIWVFGKFICVYSLCVLSIKIAMNRVFVLFINLINLINLISNPNPNPTQTTKNKPTPSPTKNKSIPSPNQSNPNHPTQSPQIQPQANQTDKNQANKDKILRKNNTTINSYVNLAVEMIL